MAIKDINVAAKLSKLTTPFLQNFNAGVNNFGYGLANALNNQFAPHRNKEGAVVKNVMNRSPMETKDATIDALNQTSLGFSNIQYPIDLNANKAGAVQHYMVFYSIANNYGKSSNKPGTFYAEENVARSNGFAFGQGTTIEPIDEINRLNEDGNNKYREANLNKLLAAKRRRNENAELSTSVVKDFTMVNTSRRITGAVSLYMPQGLKVSYKNNYEAEPTELSGTVAKGLGAAKDAQGIKAKYEIFKDVVKVGGGQQIKNFIGELTTMVGAGNPFELTTKAFGVAVNPQEEQFYKGPGFRSFTYTFDFWPRSQKEAIAVEKIIFFFKYMSSPDLEMDESMGRLFRVPSEFEIDFMSYDGVNEHIARLGRMVCTNVDVQYGPEAQNSFFKDDFPVHTKMTLDFTETELVTRAKILKGY